MTSPTTIPPSLLLLTEGKYRVISHLADGAMSSVFLGETVDGKFPVAMKLVRGRMDLTGAMASRFHDRAQKCLNLRHPKIVRLLDVIQQDGTADVAIIMERVNGPNLRRYSIDKQEDLTIGGLLSLLTDVADGIDAFHAHGMIHRDIKPDNILMDLVTNRPKIGDFGLALGVAEMDEGNEVDAFGTPAFIAPEQIIGTTFGPEVDIYSFAMTIYSLLTRSMAFDVQSTRDLIMAQIHQEPVPLRRRNRSWPHELETALARSLSKDRRARHTSARALAEHVASTLKPFTPFRLSSYFDGSLSRFSSGEVVIDF